MKGRDIFGREFCIESAFDLFHVDRLLKSELWSSWDKVNELTLLFHLVVQVVEILL